MTRTWRYGPNGLEVWSKSGKLIKQVPKADVHKAIVEFTNGYHTVVGRPLYKADNQKIKMMVFRRLAYE